MADLPEGMVAGPPSDPTLDQVKQRESGGRNLPPTANYAYPRSHASGLYQDQPSTWRAMAKEAGIGQQYGEAYQAPEKVQTIVNEAAKQKYGANSTYTWAASAPPGGYKDKAQRLPPGMEAGPAPKQKLPPGMEAGPAPGPVDPSIMARQRPAPPAQSAPGTANDQLRRDLNLPSIAQVRAAPFTADPSIAVRIKQLPQQTLAGSMRNPANPMPVRIAGGVMGAAADMVPDLPGLAKRVGAETAANTATPETAGDVAGVAQLGLRGAPGVMIKSPAIKTADGRIVEGPNHPAIRDAGTEGKEGFTTTNGQFVDRKDGAAIAKINNQAPADTRELHSEDLKPQSVGSAATNKAIMDAYKAVPPTPTKDFISSTDDLFYRLRQAATADKSQMDNYVQALPDRLKNSDFQERAYRFMEGDEMGNNMWSEQDRADYDKYIKPLKNEERDLYEEINKVSPEIAHDFNPEYVHRMVKGKSREFDPWMGEAGADASPVSGYRSRTTSSLKDRVYYAIESDKGQRKVIAVTDQGPLVLNKGQPATPLPRYQGSATGPGDKFSVGGDTWTVKQARTSEIEQHTNLRYYKNALASTIKNVVQLRAVARATAEINRLKATPEFQAYTRPLGATKPAGWESSEFPPFRDRWMQPQLAHVINDFWGAKKPALGEKMAAINRFAVGSLFWSPIPHALNAGAHWTTARGWDWVTPQGLRSVLADSAKAVHEVVTQGPEYQRLLREGSGFVYGSVANEQFYRTILKRLGEAVQQEPWKWDPIARVMGVGPSDLVKMLYGASSRALWSVSDMMTMQRVLELERKGMRTREAITEAEKHIPNYRIPPQVLGSRMFAAALKDPSLTVFSRYHYGQWKSYAHMAKDLASAYQNPGQAFKAMGNVFATAMLIGIVGPLITRGIQKITDDKNIELGPKGSTTIPVNLYDTWRGKPIEQVIQGSITLAPAPKMIYEGLTNADWFTKRNIVEPADAEQHRFGRVGAQISEEAAQQAVSPYGTAAQAAGKGGLKGAAEGVAEQGLGLRKPFKPYHGRTGGYGTLAQQAGYRHAHPRGPIEQLEKRAEQWLKQ